MLSTVTSTYLRVRTSWHIKGENVEAMTDFIFLGSKKSLQMVTAAMKWKDTWKES